ncbi:MAG TPA: beta-L-arabinofuranosidase domain-containing protein [Bryobacteraceae bacterium]|nr:beta-L-arabinofuranosidase domain-containing protein [Bryobacteraceae bacterium]
MRAIFAGLALAVAAIPLSAAAPPPVKNRAPLAENVFYRLPLTSVKPAGWLRDQLQLQAHALTGHLDEFWPDVGPNSAWLGGSGEGWERGPYYLDGLVPLAYLLDDPRLIAKVKPWIEWTLTHQSPDGSIGPAKNRDWWPLMIMLKVLTQYHEATGDPRVVPVMEKYFAYQGRELATEPLKEWAIYRWQDELASILWLYNRDGDPRLLDLARQLKSQGFDWEKLFVNFPFHGKVPSGEAHHDSHGVNNAMGLKTAALWQLISHDPADRAATTRMLRELDEFQGLPNGLFSADEHFAGRNPSQGTETCAVVEEMFSLELDLAALGDPALGDRLEKIAYNPLPGGQSADLWEHQYDQQPNQVMCSLGRRDWGTNGPESNLFGLEPNYGCCTANLHQGWPKFAASLWMASADNGLALAAYAPSRLVTSVKGVDVAIDETTDYPFRDRVSLAVSPAVKLRFPLYLRIPAWASEATVSVNGQKLDGLRAASFQRVEREWRQGDRVEIVLPMKVRTIAGFNGSISVERGPLVYSLAIGESWSKLKQTGPVTDYEVYPTSAWNYGLRVDAADPAASFHVTEAPVARQPFDRATPPIMLRVQARRLPQWVIVDDSAAPPPQSPVLAPGKDETVTLIPYAAARLRITSFPVLGPDPPAK